MLKQPIQTCRCKQFINFPEGQVKARCSCGAEWQLGPEGFWYIEFAPVLPKSRFDSFFERREKRKRRKR